MNVKNCKCNVCQYYTNFLSALDSVNSEEAKAFFENMYDKLASLENENNMFRAMINRQWPTGYLKYCSNDE